MASHVDGFRRRLARTELFMGIPDDVLQAIAERAVQRTYRKGTVLFVQGDPGERCFLIVKGTVKVSAYHADGREAVLGVLGPGDVVGELALFDDAPRSADAVAHTDLEVLSLDKQAVTKAVLEHPSLGVALLGALSRRLRIANASLQDARFFDVPGRVARRLADLAETYGVPDGDVVVIDVPVSQESLAAMVGCTRESVNKAMRSLTRRGLVAKRGSRYVVSDLPRLRRQAT